MTMTSFAPTSRDAILPSGETFDFVNPGISRVVGRTRGVLVPEFCRNGRLERVSAMHALQSKSELTDILGLLGAVVAGVSFMATLADVVLFLGGGLGWLSLLPCEPFVKVRSRVFLKFATETFSS